MMRERLQPTLVLLDQGFSLYRRHFTLFVLTAATWVIPIALLIGLLVLMIDSLDIGWLIGLMIFGGLLLLPLMLFLVIGLSRVASAVVDGIPISLREAYTIRPTRLAGMGCFSIIYLIVAQIVSSTVGFILICPMYIVMLVLIGGFSSIASLDSTLSGILIVVGAFLVVALYGMSLLLGASVYNSLLYSLQPWVQEEGGFGKLLQRSFDFVLFRFWRNLFTWGSSALIIAAVGLTITGMVGTLLPLPLSFLFSFDTPWMRALTVSAWLLGLVLVLPPLPIWMTLLYRRNRTLYDGDDLGRQLEQWQQSQVS